MRIRKGANHVSALSARYEPMIVALVSLATLISIALELGLAVVGGSIVEGAIRITLSWVGARGKAREGADSWGEWCRAGIAWGIPTDSTPPDIFDRLPATGKGKDGGRGASKRQRERMAGEARSAGGKCYFPRPLHPHGVPCRARHQYISNMAMELSELFCFSQLFSTYFSTKRPQLFSDLSMTACIYSSSEKVHQKAISNA